MNDTTVYHTPVLLQPCIDALNIKDGGNWVDATFGGGGHSCAILQALHGKGHLYGFDQDADTFRNKPDDSNFTLVYSNFRFLGNWMRYYGVDGIDGLLADLGVSSHHFDDPARGFSFRENGPLDMRMNGKARCTAAQIVNSYSEERLAQILYLYGELRNSRQIANAIVGARQRHEILTNGDFLDAIGFTADKTRYKKDLAKIFQALRIEVNREMDALKEMLLEAVRLLKPGGRLVVLTYHSLEDRMVKNIIKSGNTEGNVAKDFYGNAIRPLKAVNGKVIVPTDKEQQENPRSRSAKLRIAEKV